MSQLPVVVGVGVTPFAADRVDCNVRDLVAEAVLDCLRDAEMRWIRQEPDSTVAGGQGGVTYVFRRDPGAAEIEVEWSLKPEFAGSRSCQLASEGAVLERTE